MVRLFNRLVNTCTCELFKKRRAPRWCRTIRCSLSCHWTCTCGPSGAEPWSSSATKVLPPSLGRGVSAGKSESCSLRPVVAPQLRSKTTAVTLPSGDRVTRRTSLPHPGSRKELNEYRIMAAILTGPMRQPNEIGGTQIDLFRSAIPLSYRIQTGNLILLLPSHLVPVSATPDTGTFSRTTFLSDFYLV